MLAEEETFAGTGAEQASSSISNCPVRTMKTDGLVMLMLIPLNGVDAIGF